MIIQYLNNLKTAIKETNLDDPPSALLIGVFPLPLNLESIMPSQILAILNGLARRSREREILEAAAIRAHAHDMNSLISLLEPASLIRAG